MRSGDRLRREHELIGEVLSAVEGLLGLVAQGRSIPTTPIAGAIEFFTAYVERFHEAKEEEALFPILARDGILAADALRTIEDEHAEGRRLLRVLRPLCTRREVGREINALLESYVGLQRRHMAFEDAAVFPRAQQGLSASEDARVQQEFDRIEERVVGRGGRDVLLALAGALTQACHALGTERPAGRPGIVARDVLRPQQATIAPEDSLSRAAELMATLATRELAIVEDGAVVGILTRTDMEPHRGHLEWTAVRTAMTAHPVVVAPDAPIPTVVRLLLDGGFNAVPVTMGDVLVGMIRRDDLLRLLDGEPTRS
jgi:hemerythrin-like domain-containing protein/predicted transcriptional regulator